MKPAHQILAHINLLIPGKILDSTETFTITDRYQLRFLSVLLPPKDGLLPLTRNYLKMTSPSYVRNFNLSNVYL